MRALDSYQRASAVLLAVGVVLAALSGLSTALVEMHPPPDASSSGAVSPDLLVFIVPAMLLAAFFAISLLLRLTGHRRLSVLFVIVMLPISAVTGLIEGFALGGACLGYGAGPVTLVGCQGAAPVPKGLEITAAAVCLELCPLLGLTSIVIGLARARQRLTG